MLFPSVVVFAAAEGDSYIAFPSIAPHCQMHDVPWFAVVQQSLQTGHVVHRLPVQGDDDIARIDRVAPAKARPTQTRLGCRAARTDTQYGSAFDAELACDRAAQVFVRLDP